MADYPGIARLQPYLSKAVELFRDLKDFYIFTHIDADGISSGSIIAKTAIRLSRKFTLRTLLQLDPLSLSQIPSDINAIFVDFGSSFVGDIAEKVNSAIILDHHVIVETKNYSNVVHVNPHLVGIDGGFNISASGLAFLFSINVNDSNIDLIHMALAGATGDIQDVGKNHSFIGINEEIASMGIRYGYVNKILDFRIPGYDTKPASHAFAHSFPELPFYGNIKGAREFITMQCKVDIGPENNEKRLSELTHDEKNRILDGLGTLIAQGISKNMLYDLYGYIYTFPRQQSPFLRNSIDLANLLNACGKSNHPGIGVAILLGREELIPEAHILASQFRYKLSSLMDQLKKGGKLSRRENFFYFHLGEEGNEGMLSSLASLLIRNLDRPLIGMIHSANDMTKVSARAPMDYKGNMGIIMRKAAEKVGGTGGGHALAAGALVPSDKENEFIEIVDSLIKEEIEREESEKS
ncbi:MAG: DHH family phosphoesterase [Candidatus Korarchaeota archaeon]